MKPMLAKAAIFAAVALLIATPYSSGQGVPASVHFIPHDQAAAVMAKGGPIISDPGLVVLANHREAGPSELHEHTNHIFIMVEGEATFITGGTMVGAKETAPGEMRGTGLDGGQMYHLTKGDVITIPARTPHWWKEVASKTVSYYAINIESK